MVAARRPSRRRYVLLVIVLTALTLITLDSRSGRSGPLGALGRGAHTLVSPIQGAVDNVSSPISDWWNGLVNKGDIASENRKLKEENERLKGQERAAQHAIQLNEEYKAYLGLLSIAQVEMVTAEINGGEGIGNFDPTFQIGKGSNDGIREGMPVMSPNGLVGKVIQVWSNGAKVQTLTDPKFGVGVVTPAHPGSVAATGIALGNGSDELVADFNPGTKVKVGDGIYTSAVEHAYPPDLPVGEVTKVVEKPGGTGVRVTIKPYVDLAALRLLTVLKWFEGQGPALITTTTTSTTTTTTVPFFVPPPTSTAGGG